MRQAGRYLPEYREMRGTEDILATCRDPARVVELTLQPLRRMEVDAAILFSDIMVPFEAIGLGVRIESGRGPVIDRPIEDDAGVARIRGLEPETDVPYVLEATRLLRKELDRPLIGFAGAPFTVASYLVEGGPSRDHARTKALMMGEPALWDRLMGAIVSVVLPFMRAQAQSGAQALQLFDSWAGALSPGEYERYALPHSERILRGLADLGVPLIHFGVGTGELLGLMRGAGAEVIGVDWRVPVDVAWERAGGPQSTAVQGNLDPAVLLAPWEAVEREAREVLARTSGRDGHVFNLGHGVLPDTPPDHLRRLVDLVHAETERASSP
jgi:uroporphyrinogen decarboxylase